MRVKAAPPGPERQTESQRHSLGSQSHLYLKAGLPSVLVITWVNKLSFFVCKLVWERFLSLASKSPDKYRILKNVTYMFILNYIQHYISFRHTAVMDRQLYNLQSDSLIIKYQPGTTDSHCHIDCIPHCVLYIPMTICNYQLVFLNSFILFVYNPFPPDNHQFIFGIYDPVSVLFIMFFRFHM